MSPRAWALFLTAGVIWGVPYLFIKMAVEDMSPAVMTFSRVGLGFLVLLPLALRRGAFRGLWARWRIVLLYTCVEIAVPFTLIGWGEQRVASSLAAILVAAVPLII